MNYRNTPSGQDSLARRVLDDTAFHHTEVMQDKCYYQNLISTSTHFSLLFITFCAKRMIKVSKISLPKCREAGNESSSPFFSSTWWQIMIVMATTIPAHSNSLKRPQNMRDGGRIRGMKVLQSTIANDHNTALFWHVWRYLHVLAMQHGPCFMLKLQQLLSCFYVYNILEAECPWWRALLPSVTTIKVLKPWICPYKISLC